jgi:excisionase family DNA binding protein
MPDPQLTIEEAADRLGKPISTVRRWVATGRLPGAKVGRQWLVQASAVPPHSAVRRPPRAAAFAPTGIDLDRSLTELENRDLKDLFVQDILRHEDVLADRVAVLAAAATKLAGPGPFDPMKTIEADKTPFSMRPGADLTLEDRLAFHGAVASCAPRIDRLLADSVYSARLDKNNPKFLNLSGRDQWLRWRRDTVRLIRSGYRWLVKTDISAYFENVEHRLLFAEIDRVSPDRAVADALKRMLAEWASVNARGLPQGPDASRVLANLYLVPVDEEMAAGEWKCLRFLDDFHVLGRSRREVIMGVRTLERVLRRLGLGLSAYKSVLLEGEEAIESLRDADLDGVQYWLDVGKPSVAGPQLRRVLRGALQNAGTVNGRHALFSLYRLRVLRDRYMIPTVLRNIEQLGPVASAMTQYLHPFLGRPRVDAGIVRYLHDRERNTSPFVSAWLLGAYLDRGEELPQGVVPYASAICRNRNQATYHRVVAANVMALGRRPSDLAWLVANAKSEFDPAIVRGYVVALARVSHLNRNVEQVVLGRFPRMATTFTYLRGRNTLPSLVFPDHRAPVVSA